jgi:hypothetical protein
MSDQSQPRKDADDAGRGFPIFAKHLDVVLLLRRQLQSNLLLSSVVP